MIVLLSCVIEYTILLRGEIIEFLFPAIALIPYTIAKYFEHLNKTDFAILYSDRFEEPGFRDTKRTIHWNQVTSLRWSGSSSDRGSLTIYTKEVETPAGYLLMQLSDLTPEDRLTFIQYVRRVAVDIPQERWTSFCRRIAVPLLKKVEDIKESDNKEQLQPRTLHETIIIGSLKFFESHPFLSGLLAPVLLLPVLTLIVSRKACWTIATLLTISSLINIRLVWGGWIEPFTTAVLGTAAAFFVFGFFSISRKPEDKNPQQSLNAVMSLGYLFLTIVGVPFASSAIAKGWLPRNFASPLEWLTLALLFLPVFLIHWSQRRPNKQA